MAYLSGTQGSVLVGGVTFAFGKWRLEIETGLPKVNNFTSAFQLIVPGLTRGTVTLDGPYNAGLMPLTSGNTYVFTLGWTSVLAIAVTCIVGKITPDNNVEDAPRISVTAESNGVFVPSIT